MRYGLGGRERLTRREVLSRLALGAAGVALGCELGDAPTLPQANNGRLTARPRVAGTVPSAGVIPLLLGSGRDGEVYVPPGLPANTPVPLLLLLHGAGGSGNDILAPFQPYADQAGCVVLAPDSRGSTWDAINGFFGHDVEFINAALEAVFEQMPVDAARVGIAGFSDGATYSLALGRTNGDLFGRIVAFSPGFLAGAGQVEMPPIYITHGYGDTVLPYYLTSQVIVEELMAAGYAVTFRGFNGGHVIPAAYVPEALRWVLGGELDPEDTET